MIGPTIRRGAKPSFRKSGIPALLLSATMLAGCAADKPPEISYDADVPSLPSVPVAIADGKPKSLHVPPGWSPARGGGGVAATPVARIESANAAARVQPRREGY